MTCNRLHLMDEIFFLVKAHINSIVMRQICIFASKSQSYCNNAIKLIINTIYLFSISNVNSLKIK